MSIILTDDEIHRVSHVVAGSEAGLNAVCTAFPLFQPVIHSAAARAKIYFFMSLAEELAEFHPFLGEYCLQTTIDLIEAMEGTHE